MNDNNRSKAILIQLTEDPEIVRKTQQFGAIILYSNLAHDSQNVHIFTRKIELIEKLEKKLSKIEYPTPGLTEKGIRTFYTNSFTNAIYTLADCGLFIGRE